ncbi:MULTISPECIES: hypothetical protein [Enterobacter]|nr:MULTISPECIES: hypothetical protein [Enterobacter]NMD68637.1 hypothetical protein [Enterobacter sp. DNRA5]
MRNLLEVWSNWQMIASPPRSLHPANITAAEHMTEHHVIISSGRQSG